MVKIVGIDLGTTNSCVAIYENGAVRIIETEDGHKTVPSVVFYRDNGEILVGRKALHKSVIAPKNVIYDGKRLIGCEFSSEYIQGNRNIWSFDVIEGENNVAEIPVTNSEQVVTKLRPEAVSAEVLKALKRNAERDLKEEITFAVITVPAYFTNSQKEATKRAATIARLHVVKLIPEPTAAALAFTYDIEKKNSTILVYDLGGGTFDVSLIKLSGSEIEVKAIDGERFLGGRDFDKNLLLYVLKLIKEKYNVEIGGVRKRRVLQRLEQECETLKATLSESASATFEIYEIKELSEIELTITRDNFEEINAKLFKQTIDILDKMLVNAKVDKQEVDEVVLVGGSTRIPKIRRLVQDYFNGKELNKTVNPDEVVAIGAAYQAALLSEDSSQRSKNYAITDIVPHSLGIEVKDREAKGRHMSIVIEKNQKIPCAVEENYTTSRNFQTSVVIRIFEGESNRTNENTFLGEFVIDGISAEPKGQVGIVVTFELDLDGILHVIAKENSNNITRDLTIHLVNRT